MRHPQLTCPQPQWLPEPPPNALTEDRAAPSPVVSASTVAGLVHFHQTKRGQSSALKFRVRHHSGWQIPRRQSDQKPKQCPHLSCFHHCGFLFRLPPSEQYKAAPPYVVPATKVAGSCQADQANGGKRSVIICSARHHSCCLSPRRPNKQRQEKRHHLSCPPPQWLTEPRLPSKQRPEQRPHQPSSPPKWLAEPPTIEGIEARAAPLPVVPANTEAGCSHADRWN